MRSHLPPARRSALFLAASCLSLLACAAEPSSDRSRGQPFDSGGTAADGGAQPPSRAGHDAGGLVDAAQLDTQVDARAQALAPDGARADGAQGDASAPRASEAGSSGDGGALERTWSALTVMALVNPKDHGAAGDGAKDDLPSLIAAVAELRQVRSNGYALLLSKTPLALAAELSAVPFRELRAGDLSGELSWLWSRLNGSAY